MRPVDELRALANRLTTFVRRRQIERELDDEMRFHLDCEIAQRIARGATPDDARRAAMLAFGGIERFREEAFDARWYASFDRVVRDVRFAIRRLLRAPAFSLGTTTTLGVGLGVAAALGALVYGVMLRPLPYPAPSRLVRLYLYAPGLGISGNDYSGGTFTYVAERTRSYSAIGAYYENSAVSITDGEAPERVAAALLTPAVLRVLGVTPAVGRLLTDEDAAQGFTSPVMLSFDIWKRRYGGDSSIVGRYIELNRSKRLVAGILPSGFAFPSSETSIYYPSHVDDERASLAYRNLIVIARLTNGASILQAQRELDAILPRLGERYPEVAGEELQRARISGRVEALQAATISPVLSELRLLGAVMVVVLLIVLANVTTLALLRAERLHVEIAVVRALGATIGAVRQRFIIESLVLSLVGAMLATPIAALAIETHFGITDIAVPRLREVTLLPAIVVIVVFAVASGIANGLIMSGRAVRGDAHSLRVDARTSVSRRWRRTQEGLVAVQIAMAMALLLNAALFTVSVARLSRVDLGFVAKNGIHFALQLPFRGYETYAKTVTFDLSVVDALRQIPGVSAAAVAMEMPSTPQLLDLQPTLQGERNDGRKVSAIVRLNVVSPEFFRLMGIPLRAGRSFEAGDLAAANPGVVLSAALAHDLFGDANPVGQIVRFEKGEYPAYRVVGVSGDVFSDRVSDGALRSVYYPLLNEFAPTSSEDEHRFPVMPAGMRFLVRSELPLESLAPQFRSAVYSIDARVPIWDVRTLEHIVDATTARLRLSMLLLSAAALATLVLGGVGIYSVVAYAMSGRAPELAVRLALGASPRGVVQLVYRESAFMTAFGMVAGVLLSLAGTGIVRGLLYEVSPTDLRLIVGSTVVVALISALAIAAPARRAAMLDPADVLRS